MFLNDEKKRIFKNKTKTLLYYAVEKNNVELVNLLLQNHNIDVNSGYAKETNENQYIENRNEIIKKTPLYKAIENDNIEIIRQLLSNDKININCVNKTLKYWPKSEIKKEEENEKNETKYDKQLCEYDCDYYKSYDDNIEYFDGKEEIEETALCLAVRKNNIEIIQILLSHDEIDINIPFKLFRPWIFGNCGDESDPLNVRKMSINVLYLAVENNNVEIIQQLLNHKNLDINYINTKQNSKIKSDHYRGDEISFKKNTSEEETSLSLAIEKENLEIIKMLLSIENIDININKKQSINWFFKSRSNGASFGYLSFNERKERKQEKSMIYIAIEKQNIELITLLLSCKNIDINYPNSFYNLWIKYPVYYNICGMYNEKAQRNMKTRYNIENKIMTALHLAITIGNVDIVKLLLSNKNIDVNLLTNISTTSKNKIVGHVVLVHDRGETFDTLDRKYDENDECVNWTKMKEQTEQKTPLYLAVERKDIDICKALLSIDDIDINLLSKSSMIKKINNMKEEEIVNNIDYRKYIVDISRYDKKEEEDEEEDEVDDEEVEKEIKKDKDRTPLHLAVENGDKEIIQLLLNNEKIDVNSKDENEKTPIEYAKDEEIKEMLTV